MKSMFNASDYFFDERVHKAADHYPLLFVVPDWKLFEKKLDKELPIKKKRHLPVIELEPRGANGPMIILRMSKLLIKIILEKIRIYPQQLK